MRTLLISAAFLLVYGCAPVAEDDTNARAELQAAVAQARAMGGPPTILVIDEDGASSPCRDGRCRERAIELLLGDLSFAYETQGDLRAAREGSVWLSHPGRFWTLTFGPDGGLVGISLSAIPTPGYHTP